jgi:hypothetical protein
MIYFEYLNVKSPKGMIRATSKNTNDHIEYIPTTLQKIELMIAARIKPKTMLSKNYMHQ